MWTTSVETQVQVDRGVDRDDQLVVGEGAVGVVVAPQPLLAGRLDLSAARELGDGEAGRRRWPGVSRALSVKTMPRTKIAAAKTVSTRADPELDAGGRRCTWRGSAPRSAR